MVLAQAVDMENGKVPPFDNTLTKKHEYKLLKPTNTIAARLSPARMIANEADNIAAAVLNVAERLRQNLPP
jgi:hypothetical protein